MRRTTAVLASTALAGTMAAVPAVAAPPERTTIVDVASSSEDFETLTALVVAAGLDGALSGMGQYTVFAPTDAAFAALLGVDEATLESILDDPETTPADVLQVASDITGLSATELTDVLLYHVAHGRRDASDVLDSEQIRMLNKGFASVDADAVTIDGAPIIATDIAVDNGIIHVVGQVLLP